MELIHTTAPIKTEDLKRKFKENIHFVVDCETSRFKGKVLLTYLSNLNIKTTLAITNDETRLQLVEDYLRSPMLMDIPDMSNMVMEVLVDYLGLGLPTSFNTQPIIEQCKDVLDLWVSRINQLVLYSLYIMVDKREFIEQFPEDTESSLVGINYVHLMKHPLFALLVEDVPESTLSWNKVLFEEYVFAGNNLFFYFATPNNPLYLAATCMTEPEFSQQLISALNEVHGTLQALEQPSSIKELNHVPSA